MGSYTFSNSSLKPLQLGSFVLILLLLSGCYGTIHVKESEPEKREQLDPDMVNKGRITYVENCQDCHGENARGDGIYSERFDPKPTDLTKPGLHITTTGLESIVDFPHYSSEAMLRRIRHGSTDMPEFKKDFTEEEIRQIIAYLKFLGLNRSEKRE